MKTPLLIIGAGNVGGFLSYNIEEFAGNFEVVGFLDDDPAKIGKTLYGNLVLGPVSDITKYKDKKMAVVIGIAYPQIKMKIIARLAAFDFSFPSFVSRNVWLSKKVSIGKGVILYPGVSINYESAIADFVIMNMNCAIGHNCTVSAFSTLAPGVNLAGFTHLEEGVDMGIGASTRQNVRIGQNAVIGGQSMVIRNVPPKTKVIGVPGRELIDK